MCRSTERFKLLHIGNFNRSARKRDHSFGLKISEGYLIAYAIGAINATTLQKGIDMIYSK